jgi:hypothetical protein
VAAANTSWRRIAPFDHFMGYQPVVIYTTIPKPAFQSPRCAEKIAGFLTTTKTFSPSNFSPKFSEFHFRPINIG